MNKTRPLVVGIIGGIASGKSAVTEALRDLGAVIVSADQIGHEVLTLPDVIDALVAAFGEVILKTNGAPGSEMSVVNDNTGQQLKAERVIDRQKLAALVFGTEEIYRTNRSRLESIVHPRIRAIAKERIANATSKHLADWIVLDAPLLIEGGWVPFCDRIIYVDTDAPVRLQRALERGWTETQWRQREAAQKSLDEKRAVATDVVKNNLSIEELRGQVAQMVQRWK